MAYHIFAYLLQNKPHAKKHVFDDAMPSIIDKPAFHGNCDWQDLYDDETTEDLPPKMPKPLVRPVHIGFFIDANHAGNLVTRAQVTTFMYLSVCHECTDLSCGYQRD